MSGKKIEEVFVRGEARELIYGDGRADSSRVIPYFTLEDDEYVALQQAVSPVQFRLSRDIPVLGPNRIGQLINVSVALAAAIKILYQDQGLRQRALPKYLHELAGDDDLIMSGVGFDFLVGPHLKHPMFLEAAAFGPEFASSAAMADFYGLRPLEDSLDTWAMHLVEPVLGGDDSLYLVTSIGDFEFARELEHEVLAAHLRDRGVRAEFGPAEDPLALKASTVYLRAGLLFTQTWERLSRLPLGRRIQAGRVKVIPPAGNNFCSSKYVLPILANPEELVRRGVSKHHARLIELSMPSVFWYEPGMLGFIKRVVNPRNPLWFKAVWNFGGYCTRKVADGRKIAAALREIRQYGEMPVVVEEDVQAGFLARDGARDLPERRVEVRVRVFDHGDKIKAVPSAPSARVYLPGDSFPFDALLLGPDVLPQER